jgi:hypothetical protein
MIYSSRWARWAMNLERMGELRNGGHIYAGEIEGKRSLGRSRRRGKMILR